MYHSLSVSIYLLFHQFVLVQLNPKYSNAIGKAVCMFCFCFCFSFFFMWLVCSLGKCEIPNFSSKSQLFYLFAIQIDGFRTQTHVWRFFRRVFRVFPIFAFISQILFIKQYNSAHTQIHTHAHKTVYMANKHTIAYTHILHIYGLHAFAFIFLIHTRFQLHHFKCLRVVLHIF